ncbi:hypothetical protein V6N13_003075 [Hibiscus sabdariffa]|uniref:Uncharacterized protein n=1 Tax=Hibiscus sabdariffa TaxID=183260 RepID=A0ABR2NDR5_9ROSI
MAYRRLICEIARCHSHRMSRLRPDGRTRDGIRNFSHVQRIRMLRPTCRMINVCIGAYLLPGLLLLESYGDGWMDGDSKGSQSGTGTGPGRVPGTL